MHLLFDEHLFYVYKPSIPTICVGNLAVGGTGKTPHVEYLLRLLSPSFKVAVLSRGYGRKTRGFILADEQSTAQPIGDEPMQIHRKFPDVPVAVAENRVRGIHLLQARIPDLQVVVLDDAFQHRRLKCGSYILLTAYDRLYVNDHYLPWGRLRDNRTQALRANMVVVTKCPADIKPIDCRIVENKLHLPTFQSLHFSTTTYEPLPFLTPRTSCLVVTGIAHPEYLMDYIQRTCPNAQLLDFPDHHAFTSRDMQLIESRSETADCVITTEKDAERLNLVPLSDALKAKLHVVPVSMKLTDEEVFRNRILRYLKKATEIKNN